MGQSRRDVLWVMGGGALGAGLWTNKRQLRETFDVPRYESTDEVGVPLGVVHTTGISYGGRPSPAEFSIDVSQGAVRAGVTAETGGGYMTAFTADYVTEASAVAGETSITRFTLEPGDYTLIFQSDSPETSVVTYSIKLY